jgi:hypothetical protein
VPLAFFGGEFSVLSEAVQFGFLNPVGPVGSFRLFLAFTRIGICHERKTDMIFHSLHCQHKPPSPSHPRDHGDPKLTPNPFHDPQLYTDSELPPMIRNDSYYSRPLTHNLCIAYKITLTNPTHVRAHTYTPSSRARAENMSYVSTSRVEPQVYGLRVTRHTYVEYAEVYCLDSHLSSSPTPPNNSPVSLTVSLP